MGTKICNDIENDLKLLITSIIGFEESDEGFRICERYVVSNIKHHRYLSINSHATKKLIEDIKNKYIIYGKYSVAKEFTNLVDTFLTSTDFDQCTQYDFQWTLLSFLLNLSNESDKSNVECLQLNEHSKCNNISTSEDAVETDWGDYLREGQEDFFCDYASDSSSEWSEDDEAPEEQQTNPSEPLNENKLNSPKISPTTVDTFSSIVESRKWLDANLENTWWNNITWHECKVLSEFPHAHLCDIYTKEILNNSQVIVTISEYQACREVLWMLHMPMEMVVYEEPRKDCFSVRKNLSLPSTTPTAFDEAFSSFTQYFSMIRSLQIFEENLFDIYKQSNLPPLTYETYNAATKQYLNKIKENLVRIERNIMKQNDITTFFTLSRELRKDCERIKMLATIHRSATYCDNAAPNWEKSYRLLAGLYREIENSSSCERTNLCASLYLSSLRVYLNIIDTWLSEGRLEDFRNEFLISKITENTDDEQNTTKFIVRQPDNHDPIMKKLFSKVRDMGRSIELLVTLDRISDMWKIHGEQSKSRVPLKDEFITEVIEELAKYSSNCTDELDTNEKMDTPNSTLGNSSADLEANIRQQVLRINNPFLMKVFQNYLPPMGLTSGDTVDAQMENQQRTNNWGINIFHSLQKISPYILPFRKVLEDVLVTILNRRYSIASKLVKDILVNEYKLEHHLKLMRSIYMMERGHIMKKFYQHMFTEIENNSCWINPYDLTSVLEEILSDEWRDTSSHNHWSITVEDHCTRQVLKAVERTTLNYSIGWPVNMVLTDEVLAKYNAIFRFQLKLKWALWSLDNLRFVDLEGNNNDMSDVLHHFYARRLESLRFWLLHAVGSIHTYLSGQVLQSLGFIFDKALAQANNLDDIIQIHGEYLDKVHEHCLQTSQFTDIMVTINNLLGMCAHIRDRWHRGVSQLIPTELDLMESSYTKYHTYLALALHNAVQHKEADYHKSNPHFPLMRNLLAEIAHQSYPPSGIPIPIPPFVQQQSLFWSERSKDEKLPDELSLSEYDDTFRYIWYTDNSMAQLANYSLSEEFSNLFNDNYG